MKAFEVSDKDRMVALMMGTMPPTGHTQPEDEKIFLSTPLSFFSTRSKNPNAAIADPKLFRLIDAMLTGRKLPECKQKEAEDRVRKQKAAEGSGGAGAAMPPPRSAYRPE